MDEKNQGQKENSEIEQGAPVGEEDAESVSDEVVVEEGEATPVSGGDVNATSGDTN